MTVNTGGLEQKTIEDMQERIDELEANKPIIVSLGDLYADSCEICGARAYWGVGTQRGPDGCVEAIKAGMVFCEKHLPPIYGMQERIDKLETDLRQWREEVGKKVSLIDRMQDKVDRVYSAGMAGINYVEQANYTHRAIEARDKLRAALEDK